MLKCLKGDFNMRFKRKKYFRKLRWKKIKNFFLLVFVMPALLVIAGYLLASIVILPSMSG